MKELERAMKKVSKALDEANLDEGWIAEIEEAEDEGGSCDG